MESARILTDSHPLRLHFPNRMHSFVTLDRSVGCPERTEALARSGSFPSEMIKCQFGDSEGPKPVRFSYGDFASLFRPSMAPLENSFRARKSATFGNITSPSVGSSVIQFGGKLLF